MTKYFIDFVGNAVGVDDTVCFMQIGYRQLMLGQVVKITPNMVVIKHEATNTGSCESKQGHKQVVRVGTVMDIPWEEGTVSLWTTGTINSEG